MSDNDIDAMVARNLMSGAYDRYFYYESDEPLKCPKGHVAIPARVRLYVFNLNGEPLKSSTFDDTFCAACSECESLFNIPSSWDDGPIHTQTEPPTSPQTRQVFYGRVREHDP